MLTVPLILEGLLGIAFKGNVPMIIVAGSLLIVGYLALGALLQLLVRDLATGLGLTGLVVSPAFGYAGVGFPVLGMNAFAYVWGAILPLRWYMAVLLGQAARGLPLSDLSAPFAALAALTVLYTLLAILRACGRSRKENGSRTPVPRRNFPRPRRVASAVPLSPSGSACSRCAAPSFCLFVGPLDLWHLLPTALPEPDPAQDTDRGRR